MSILDKNTLISNVKDIADRIYPRWVLFENGTFVMLRDDQQPIAIGFWAVQILETEGIVTRQNRDLKFSVTPAFEGWLVTGDYWAIYTYVHKSEIKTRDLKEIGQFGMAKRHSDSVGPRIIFLQDEL